MNDNYRFQNQYKSYNEIFFFFFEIDTISIQNHDLRFKNTFTWNSK